jgi:hypothetical protein
MRKQLLMVVALSCMAGIQWASAQTSAVAAPASPRPEASTAEASHAMTAAPSVVADPAAANPAIPVRPMENGNEAKAKKSKPQRADSEKSPYWEPRDWTYIYNQGP